MKQNLHTPWSDEIKLYDIPDKQDAEGFGVSAPQKRELLCTFDDGVSQKEFYYSHKEGLQASASVELWKADYRGEEYADFGGRHYRVLRSFNSSFDCVTLILTEVVR